MKPIYHFFTIALLFFSLSSKAQHQKASIESLNTSLVAYAVPVSGKDAYFQIRTEELGRKFIFDLYLGDKLISQTSFYPNQVKQIEMPNAPAGNPFIRIISKDGKMIHKSITENKKTFIAEENIPLKTSEAEALKVKNALNELFKL